MDRDSNEWVLKECGLKLNPIGCDGMAQLVWDLRIVVCLQEAKNAVGTQREEASPHQPQPAQQAGKGPKSHPMVTLPHLHGTPCEDQRFLRSRRDKRKEKKSKKKKDGSDSMSNKEDKSDVDDKEERGKSDTPTPEVDEEGYCIRPKVENWENDKASFYSSSDTDSDDERERKIHVEIKPLSNGSAPISASVDELRATVENISLSSVIMASGRRSSTADSDHHMKRSQSVSQQLGSGKPSSDLLGLNLYQSPTASSASTPTGSHPYAPLQSPSQPIVNSPAPSSTSRYADGNKVCKYFNIICYNNNIRYHLQHFSHNKCHHQQKPFA
ncbi:unnamed protein product [Timema podura]|uniref:Uncharacterized protein n=1 Tax=Timema podura TaxID=61482 RepID=A0ABN7NDZ1_TIMPD|nr:unnamed protein product [Timema podura]